VKPKPESQNPQAKRQKPSETKMKPKWNQVKSSAANNKEKRSQTFKECQKQTAQTTQGEEERTDLQNTKCTAELPRKEPAQCTRHPHTYPRATENLEGKNWGLM
jgi:hypothetical protein